MADDRACEPDEWWTDPPAPEDRFWFVGFVLSVLLWGLIWLFVAGIGGLAVRLFAWAAWG